MSKFLRFLSATSMLVTILLTTFSMSFAAGVAPSYSPPNGLIIGQVKMTGEEYLVLQNNTTAAINDLSSYWLYAFNKTNPNDTGTTSSGQQLPAGRLDVGQTLVLSSKARPTCGATIAGDLSLSLGDSAGYLQLVKQTYDSSKLSQITIDSVSWSSGTTGIITKVPSNTAQPAAVYYRAQDVASGWQLAVTDAENSCQLNALLAGTTAATAPTVTGLATTTSEPPAMILSAAVDDDSSDTPSAVTPAADIGLQAPQLTELLPNPTGTGNDETDEFIELYNPNAVPFDLSGFVLQTGLTTKHSYTFPVGTSLAAHGFTAFTSDVTSLSLSNTSGAANLLDPPGNEIAKSDAYGTAKDGVAWARANGKWQWTLQPTPNAANVIKPPAVKAPAKSKSPKNAKGTATNSKTSSTKLSTTTAGFANTANTDDLQVTPIHSWTLAAAAGLAVAYGIYEYRLDLANRFYRLRRYYADRRSRRQSS